jgi:CHAT domain-containing protein/tetratricopeptide (TPR) repeat protein
MFVLLLVLALGFGSGPPAAAGQDDSVAARAAMEAGRFEAAEGLARQNLDGVRARAPQDHLAVAQAAGLCVDALILNGNGAQPSTLALAEEGLRLTEMRLGPTHEERAPLLVGVGRALFAAGRYSDAIGVLRRAVAASEKRSDNSGTTIAALDALGRALDRAGQFDEALTALRRLEALEHAAGAPARQRARTAQALASVLQSKGSYPDARTALERALALHTEAGLTHPAVVETWVQEGSQLWFEGRLTEAEAALTRAVRLAETTLRADHPLIAHALRKLAATEIDLGKTVAARSLNERALAIVERSLPKDHVEVAAYLNNLANSNMLTGDYPAARRYCARALAIAHARYGERHDWVATFIHNLAIVDARLGDFAAARREHARAIAIWEVVYGRTHQVVAVALTEMADAWSQDGSPATAIPMLERALAIRVAKFGDGHRDVARTMAALALALDRVGQTARAGRMVERARTIFDALPDPPAPDVAQVLSLAAAVAARRGDFAAARRDYSRAREIRTDLLGQTHPLVAETGVGLAETLAATGDPDGAFAIASDAEAAAREHLRLTLRYLPERESLNFQRSRTRGLDLMVSLAGGAPELAGPAFDAVIRSRALVLDEMMSRRRVDTLPSPAIAELEARVEAARRSLATLVVRGTGDADPARVRAVLDAAQRESDLAEGELAASSADYRAARMRARLGLQDVQAGLPSDATLVAFHRFDKYAGLRRVPAYAAFVLRPEGTPVMVTLGTAAEIDGLVTRWRQAIAREAGTGESGDSRTAGVLLRRRLWDPLLASIGSPRRILIVPDGSVSLVPLAALPIGTRGYLVEREATLHYLTAERDVTEPAAASSGRGLLALGGASFGARTVAPAGAKEKTESTRTAAGAGVAGPCADVSTIQFEPLAGSQVEVQQIARVWRSAIGSAEDVCVLSGPAAREEAFVRYAPGSRVLHLATHGFFLDAGCAERLPGTRAVGGLAPTRPAAKGGTVRPTGGISALALAGANRRSRTTANDADGILLAEEVAAMRLNGVEWAVLSACDTGIGALVAGEGVLGLRRAFQLAGVRTVIMTLWPVDDQSTTELMRQLYQARFVEGLTSDRAMRAASLRVLRARRAAGRSTHPFFWAAFLAAGDWR